MFTHWWERWEKPQTPSDADRHPEHRSHTLIHTRPGQGQSYILPSYKVSGCMRMQRPTAQPQQQHRQPPKSRKWPSCLPSTAVPKPRMNAEAVECNIQWELSTVAEELDQSFRQRQCCENLRHLLRPMRVKDGWHVYIPMQMKLLYAIPRAQCITDPDLVALNMQCKHYGIDRPIPACTYHDCAAILQINTR